MKSESTTIITQSTKESTIQQSEKISSLNNNESFKVYIRIRPFIQKVVPTSKSSFIKSNPELIKSFTKAIQKGLDFVNSHDSLEIAKIIKPQFSDTKIETIENAVESYKNISAWPESTSFSKKSFNHLQDIMIEYGIIDNKVDYNKLIYER